jgi:cytochrome c-type biogenesis protein CcmF
MFPTLSEALRGRRLTVGPPFFNKWMLPIGLILLLLTGIGPLLAWRKSTVRNLVEQFLWPSAACVVTAVALYAVGVRVWTSGICFALCAFVVTTVLQELIRGAQVRKGATGTDIITAMIGLVGRSRRRYGGYIVHVGIVLMFLGFAGQGFHREEQVPLKVGQQTTLGPFTVRHDALRVTNDAQKQMVTADVSVFEGTRQIDRMHPARWFFAKHEDEPTTEVAIRRAVSEDLYLVLGSYNVSTQEATYKIVINPLVNWIWFGFAVMALGTGLALLPESAFAFAAAKVPSGAVTTSLLLLFVLWPAPARAQHVENPQAVIVPPQSQLEKDLQSEIICMCGTCGRKRIGECTCSDAAQMREEVAKLVAEGKSREQIYAYYIAKYGSQEPLASPIDEGFNRLAWFFPYLIGATGAASIAVVAFRWSRRETMTEPSETAAETSEDPTLRERLDDELRDLD